MVATFIHIVHDIIFIKLHFSLEFAFILVGRATLASGRSRESIDKVKKCATLI